MANPEVHRRSEYRLPEYITTTVELTFTLRRAQEVEAGKTRATLKAALTMQSNPAVERASGELPAIHLDRGEEIKEITSVAINGRTLEASEYQLTETALILPGCNEPCVVTLEVPHDPDGNKKRGLGLYTTSGIVVTQQESIGTRELYPSQDRPDVLPTKWITQFDVTESEFPVVLATGDLKEYERDEAAGTHRGTFVSNVPMPSYVHAFVAGKLDSIEVEYEPKSGRAVKLKVFAKPGEMEKHRFSLRALKSALAWDEEHFGLEYPLDEFRIVVIEDFNSGAMENLGLNIFNTSNAPIDPRVQEDDILMTAMASVAHEVLHTWRGNMVTVKTWHEIALKEGFAAYADGQWEQDFVGSAVPRLRDIRKLRGKQFAEDAGASAHAILPEEYTGDPMHSMYTATIYVKGGEVIGMLETILGKAGFRKGCDEYFSANKGKAATIEDLIAAMEKATGIDLNLFRNWFKQVGTPVCQVKSNYNQATQRLELTVKQSCSRAPHLPLHIPMTLGLIGPDGKEISKGIFNITEPEKTLIFDNVPPGTVPSLFRNLSAPVKVEYDYSVDDLMQLMKHDTDAFNQYDACERIAKKGLNELMADESAAVNDNILEAYGYLLENIKDPSLTAEMLTLPDVQTLVQDMDVYDFQAAKRARDKVQKAIAEKFEGQLLKLYTENGTREGDDDQVDQGVPDVKAMARRKLKNVCLSYLMTLGDKHKGLAWAQFKGAKVMTDKLGAFRVLLNRESERKAATEAFYDLWKEDELVVRGWLRAQALMDNPNAISILRAITESGDKNKFNIERGTHIHNLLGFGLVENPVYYHDSEGKGYELVADILLQMPNASYASHLANFAFSGYPKMNPHQQDLMRAQMERVRTNPKVHAGVKIRIDKILEFDANRIR